MQEVLRHWRAALGLEAHEFIGRFVVFTLMDNIDARLKNCLLVYPNGRDPPGSPY